MRARCRISRRKRQQPPAAQPIRMPQLLVTICNSPLPRQVTLEQPRVNLVVQVNSNSIRSLSPPAPEATEAQSTLTVEATATLTDYRLVLRNRPLTLALRPVGADDPNADRTIGLIQVAADAHSANLHRNRSPHQHCRQMSTQKHTTPNSTNTEMFGGSETGN